MFYRKYFNLYENRMRYNKIVNYAKAHKIVYKNAPILFLKLIN